MRHSSRNPVRLCLVSAESLLLIMFFAASGKASEPVHRKFNEVDALFANPGQGWMSQQRSPRNEPRFPCSVVYIRFDWAAAEPEEGKFNWKIIDDVVEAWKPRGAAVALRVMTCNAHSSGYYSSPKWLFDAGCKGDDYLKGGDDPTSGGKRIPRIEPDYSDPIYLQKHGAFLKALGERYDGNPNIEFLDIGSYGIWGEWHTSHAAPVEIRKAIVDMYLSAFRKTPLVFMSDDAEVLKYALARGTGFRRDGVGSPWHEQNWIGSKKYSGVEGMADTWKRAPIVFEWFGNYAYLESRKWSFEAAVNFMLNNHVTLINDNVGAVPRDAMPQLENLARRAGARFVLREINHEGAVKAGSTLQVSMKWDNVGVGKLNRQYHLSIALRDHQGRQSFASIAKADPRDWLPGEHRVAETITLPSSLEPGEYLMTLALVTDDSARPFRLAMDAPEMDGRYEISRVKVEPGLPQQVDLRPEFQKLKWKQRRQGSRGTCSVFATVEAVEFEVGKSSGVAEPLSVEFANWAANAATRRSDDGDFFHNIITGIEKYGICAESAMRYRRSFSPTNTPSAEAMSQAERFHDSTELSFHWIRKWSRAPGLEDTDIDQIKSALARGHPVSAGSYHSILFVGYEDDKAQPGGGRFFVADSNMVERDLTYEAAKKRMCDLFWVTSKPKPAAEKL